MNVWFDRRHRIERADQSRWQPASLGTGTPWQRAPGRAASHYPEGDIYIDSLLAPTDPG